MSEDEIVKTAEIAVKPKMTPAERMAKARAARGQKKPEETVSRQAKKAPIFEEETAAARTPTRSSARTTPDGRLEVTGRNGEVLSRTRTQVGDIFEIPKEMIPVGWSMQWNAISVAGNADILMDQTHMMYQNGWRPVPAERYAGTLVPKGSKGNIVRGQQMLMERPAALTEEARAEDIRNAMQLVNDRNESLKLTGVKKNLAPGFEMSGKYKNTGGGVRIAIDKSLDVLNVNQQAGSYDISE